MSSACSVPGAIAPPLAARNHAGARGAGRPGTADSRPPGLPGSHCDALARAAIGFLSVLYASCLTFTDKTDGWTTKTDRKAKTQPKLIGSGPTVATTRPQSTTFKDPLRSARSPVGEHWWLAADVTASRRQDMTA